VSISNVQTQASIARQTALTCMTGKREKTVLRSLSLMMERDLEMEVESLGVPELRSFSVSYKVKYTILYLSTFSHKLTTSMQHEKVH